MTDEKSHYDAHYFSWQQGIGHFGGEANLGKFERYVRPEDSVLDFGCGGGYLLAQLRAREKLGVEIIPEARRTALESFGLTVHPSTSDVPDEWADVVISNNALEHTMQPLTELSRLLPKLRPGGLAVFVVPCESISYRYRPHDVNQHLYSWSPMCLGNLFTTAGYEVITCEPYIHKWPPHHLAIRKWFGRRAFDLSCRIYGRIARSWFQVRIVARRPERV